MLQRGLVDRRKWLQQSEISEALARYARFRSFGRFAGTAAVGLLAVTAAALARPVFELHPALLGGAVLVFAAERFAYL
jgi:hypothetical protein